MINRTTKLRWRRRFRRSRRQVEDIGVQAEEHLERHVIRRLGRLYEVRRFVLGWLILLSILISLVVTQIGALSYYYQDSAPTPGGIYAEGMKGAFTNANPLYATGGVDGAVSRLVFSGLLKYDRQNQLVGDLAESWTLDPTERIYTIVLRENLKWHDGQALTSGDVVFTYKLIQNPDARSPLFGSWQTVRVQARDDRTITFTLPNVLSSFPFSLTNGIVPRHMLEKVQPSELRSDLFNNSGPVGSGPFKWDAIEVSGRNPEDREERIGLVPNGNYHLGTPKLQRFIIRAFRSETRMVEAFRARELNAMVGLDEVPNDIKKSGSTKSYSIPITAQVMAFFNNTNPILSDARVRQALVVAVDTKLLRSGLTDTVIAADSPFLREHFAYSRDIRQLTLNVDRAKQLLNEAGWIAGGNTGIRQKDGQPLRIRLHAKQGAEQNYVTKQLQEQWRTIGVEVSVEQPSDNDFQSTLTLHNYDVLLYGISLGVDPDVFAFWHSSQTDPRSPAQLNFSQYKSAAADTALEGGRTRADPGLRKIKYTPFLEAWRNDAPALALYQPRFLYVVNGTLYNFEPPVLNSATGRFNNVHNWMIRQTKVNKP